ncbi:regulatory protein GemA [Ancylobacter defluvii]|uniref:Regulatory protein GemA n=1 Tax=Ancylobacter defluvii TaxID=1282440 RepID=A0A9W6NCE3_9HYPH|nr:regulatory protein GemA [Ancylobacter defluvii]MBS7586427.1 regulatory protein GemA [Ancylobacter defluvii]GLK85708.1 hypothetical protein GCM10017653_37780 [Ancylobacter defluvii]
MLAVPLATNQQKAAIHALKTRAGLDDDHYRDMLRQQVSATSSKNLTRDQAGRVIEHLKLIAGQSNAPAKKKPLAEGALALDGPYAGVCRALWLAGWNLGVFEDRRDTALVAFVERQTGLKAMNWLRDEKDGRAVVEALKAWIGRTTDVAWDADAKMLRLRGISIARWRKLAVVRAQCRKLAEPAPADLDAKSNDELNRLQAELGRRVRRLGERRKRA